MNREPAAWSSHMMDGMMWHLGLLRLLVLVLLALAIVSVVSDVFQAER